MQQSKLYRLIIDSKYRVWRHLLFIFTLVIITFNQIFIAYQDSITHLGNTVFLICLLSFITYLITTYLNYFFLIPKFLLKEKYTIYIALLLFFVIALMGCTHILEYSIRTIFGLSHRIKSYSNPIILVDSLSSSVITIICLWSMSVITLFRKWNKKNEDLMILEHSFLESEVNKLKGQISPIFMSKALRKAAAAARSDSKKASEILMLLGHLLRYQLYDCDRKKVFLRSEATFIKNLLQLKRLIDDIPFEYTLDVKGNINNLLISPLLLIVLIQRMLIDDDVKRLAISMQTVEKKLVFIANFTETSTLAAENSMEITEKLNMLYPDSYEWTTESGKMKLKLDLSQWN